MTDATATVGGHSFAPFSAEEIKFASVPQAGTPEYNEFIIHYMKAAFALVRDTPNWKKTKNVSYPDCGTVYCKSLPSGMKGKLGKCAWHLRESQHTQSQSGLVYNDFYNYLRYDHPIYEEQYIPNLTIAEQTAEVKKHQVDVWHTAYKLPMVTADRDFVQLLLSLELPPHHEPFSEDHEKAAIASYRDQPSQLDSAHVAKKSFLVLQIPVTHPGCPEAAPKVRGTYASFEAVWEGPIDDSGESHVVWKMAVQSDTRGKIPVVMQEMSMPGEIAHDVPAFVGWAKKQKSNLAA